MNVSEFNAEHALHKLHTDADHEVKVLRKEGLEWFVEINNKRLWVHVKKPKDKLIRQELIKHNSSLIPNSDLELGASLFFVLHYLRHITGDTIHQPKAAEELQMTARTFRTHLQNLKKLGRIDYETNTLGTKLKYVDGKVGIM